METKPIENQNRAPYEKGDGKKETTASNREEKYKNGRCCMKRVTVDDEREWRHLMVNK